MVAQAVSAVALVLLVASGWAKLVDPDPTRGAMKAARLPSSRLVSRVLGLTEIVAAIAGLALGTKWLALAALLYLGFAVFTTAAVRRRLPIQSCGCFGRADTPPTNIHVTFNIVATVALAYLAIATRQVMPWEGPPLELALYLSFSLIGAYLAYLVLSQLPRTLHLTNTR
ncbi:MAG: MauE/DoxX family redox-associated membrane protein [Acidimicrobiia bacterium]